MSIKDTLLGMNLDPEKYAGLCSFDAMEDPVIAVREVDRILNNYGQNTRHKHAEKPNLMKDPKHFSMPGLVEHIAESETRDKVKKFQLLDKYVREVFPEAASELGREVLLEDNPYLELDASALLDEYGEAGSPRLKELKRHEPQLFEAMRITGLVNRMKGGKMPDNIRGILEKEADKEAGTGRYAPKKRARKAVPGKEGPQEHEGEDFPAAGYGITDETPSGHSAYSPSGPKIMWNKFDREELEEMVRKLLKSGGMLPSHDHPFCKRLINAGAVTGPEYRRLITVDTQNRKIRRIFEHFGIESPDGAAGEVVSCLFNRAYFPASRGEDIPDDAISSRMLEPYINENHLAEKYAEERGLSPEKAKKQVLKIGMYAFKEGLKEFRQRLEETEFFFLVNVPAFYLDV